VLLCVVKAGLRLHWWFSSCSVGCRSLWRCIIPSWVHAWWWAETNYRQLLQPTTAIRPQTPSLCARIGFTQCK